MKRWSMLTVEDFRKLGKMESDGYHIYIDGDEVYGLDYDEDVDWMEFLDASEEMRCTFTFVDDKYQIVQYLKNFQNSEWTVERHEVVEWR